MTFAAENIWIAQNVPQHSCKNVVGIPMCTVNNYLIQ